jgi:anaerobic magnesium-protoporphyrin IX monomethyl ester cyclase
MKEKVFLLNPPGDVIRTGRLVRKSKISTQSWFPIHLAYATGVLEKMGHECKLYDSSVTKDTVEDVIAKIKNFKPDFISYFWAYDTSKEDLLFADKLASDWDLTLVGPWSAHLPNALDLCKNINIMTFGEFEYTLSKLYGGVDKKNISGLKYKEDGEIFFNPQNEPYTSKQLDWMPFVTDVYKRHLNIPAYHQTSFRHPFIDLFSARSCPFRCAFCSWTNGCDLLHPKRYIQRSLNNVMEELWYVKNELPEVKQLFFQDSTLIASRAKEISTAMIEQKIRLCWGAYSRADKDYSTLKLMKDAGCRTLHIGYEVPIQSILDEIKKDITVEQEAQFIKDVNKLNLWTSSSFMIFPWMSEKQIHYMIKWIKDNGATRINVAQLQPYPNAPIIDVMKAHADVPGQHMMDFEEMKKWEQFCFNEFYVKNPKFWWNVISNPHEWESVFNDGLGMVKFLFEK